MIIDNTIVTYHSVIRAMERGSIKNPRSAEKSIALALRKGKRASDFSSWERSYLIKEAFDDCTAIAYNNFCYIVNSNGVCVTLYPLPVWFGKKKRFDGKERIRNCKKYQRNYQYQDHEDLLCDEDWDSMEELDADFENSWDEDWEVIYSER